MSFKDTRTAENLMKSFAGECQARMRYEYSAKTAKKEGFEQISNIFIETALNEKEHAKVFFRHLLKNGIEGEMINITASYPVGWSETENATIKNLDYAANGENEEWTELYPMFADIAEEEGYKDIAASWRLVSKVEKEHEKRLWEYTAVPLLKEISPLKNMMISIGKEIKRMSLSHGMILKAHYIHQPVKQVTQI